MFQNMLKNTAYLTAALVLAVSTGCSDDKTAQGGQPATLQQIEFSGHKFAVLEGTAALTPEGFLTGTAKLQATLPVQNEGTSFEVVAKVNEGAKPAVRLLTYGDQKLGNAVDTRVDTLPTEDDRTDVLKFYGPNIVDGAEKIEMTSLRGHGFPGGRAVFNLSLFAHGHGELEINTREAAKIKFSERPEASRYWAIQIDGVTLEKITLSAAEHHDH